MGRDGTYTCFDWSDLTGFTDPVPTYWFDYR